MTVTVAKRLTMAADAAAVATCDTTLGAAQLTNAAGAAIVITPPPPPTLPPLIDQLTSTRCVPDDALCSVLWFVERLRSFYVALFIRLCFARFFF